MDLADDKVEGTQIPQVQTLVFESDSHSHICSGLNFQVAIIPIVV